MIIEYKDWNALTTIISPESPVTLLTGTPVFPIRYLRGILESTIVMENKTYLNENFIVKKYYKELLNKIWVVILLPSAIHEYIGFGMNKIDYERNKV